jgi:malate synthase
MEDAATEISRTQVWQWLRNEVKLDDGRAFTTQFYKELLAEEVAKIKIQIDEENNKVTSCN